MTLPVRPALEIHAADRGDTNVLSVIDSSGLQALISTRAALKVRLVLTNLRRRPAAGR